MRIPGLVVPLLFVAGLLVIPAGHASQENAAAFTRSILERISASPVPCRGSMEGAGPSVVSVCARWGSDFERFRDAWDRAARSGADPSMNARPVTDWQTQVGGRIRWYAFEDKWIVVTLDSSREIRVSYTKDHPDVLQIDRNVTPPRRIPTRLSDSEERREVRRGVRPEVTGVVVMSAVIRKNGSVGDVEVLGCLPRRRGLEQAAIDAIKKWRYEPATKDGFPVNVAMVSAFTYGPGGTFRVSDGSDYRDNAQNRTGGVP